MSIRASICASFEDTSFDPANNLVFYKDGNWWSPEPVTGPDLAQTLYGKQLAVDFLQWSVSTDNTEKLVDIINAMPAEKGGVERGFIEFIASRAPAGAMA
ncbi:hypothetical protein AB7849_11545 [Rhodanobacter sp. 115]|uniref:hypothetical protein n=1 Tax=Rhodanobacter sp. FW021-MT20 TaxID=1162282 RepID=UPI000260D252|nr:hypothetical protein [Rhodanobacter sp. 115]EIL98228.1 hypothetical protein UU5_03952 [Rhodanobacter sp. 115]